MFAALVSSVLSGCALPSGPPPSLDDDAMAGAVSVWSRDRGTRVICYRLEPSVGRALLPELAAARADVAERLGLEPPRAEVVIFRPSAALTTDSAARETRAELTFRPGGWVVRFATPVGGSEAALGELVAAVAHEVAEGTLVSHVTVLDPYLRWLHDGIADWVEHQVLAHSRPTAARELLRGLVVTLRELQRRGVQWADLTRWRQLAPWVIRSHRFFGPDASDLSLTEPTAALQRVRVARAAAAAPALRAGLAELEAMVTRAQAIQKRPWAQGELRSDGRLEGDLGFYAVAFAWWLELEAAVPGIVRQTAQALAQRRGNHDHVISADEALVAVRRLAGEASLPSLARYPIAKAVRVLETELGRVGGGPAPRRDAAR